MNTSLARKTEQTKTTILTHELHDKIIVFPSTYLGLLPTFHSMITTKLLRKFYTALHLPLWEKMWFIILYPLSGIIRAAVLCLPFRFTSRFLGLHYKNYQLSTIVSPSQEKLARRIGHICKLSSRYTPWESKCLVQAFLAHLLLKFYGIPYVIHLGVRITRDEPEAMKAHAWVKVGGLVVCGREGHKAHAIVSTFISPPAICAR